MKPQFIGEPDVHWLPDGKLKLDRPLLYISLSGRIFEVPAGFITDLASVPRFLPGLVQALFRGPLQTASAAILHDWLYEQGRVPRSEADALFWEALRAEGERPVGAWVMWAGVRLGGWFRWRQARSAVQEPPRAA